MTDELVTAFILVSGQEVIFKGVRSGNFAELYDMPKLAQTTMGEIAQTPGHIIQNPFVAIPPAPHMGSGWRLEPWPRIRRWGTCGEFFVANKDVMFQLMTTEIDEEILALYYKVLADQKWREDHATSNPLG